MVADLPGKRAGSCDDTCVSSPNDLLMNKMAFALNVISRLSLPVLPARDEPLARRLAAARMNRRPSASLVTDGTGAGR